MNKWISVKDSYPKHKQLVLTRNAKGVVRLATFINIMYAENQFVSQERFGISYHDISHWCAIPEFTND